MDKQNNMLRFNGQIIGYTIIDGVVYIAIRSICKALGLNVDRQIKKIKNDPILSDAYTVASTRDSENRIQKMAVLPEDYLYGWLFNVNSTSGAILEYKKECYRVLHKYFKGTINQRNKMLMKKTETLSRMNEIEERLKNNSADYQELSRLKGEHLKISKILKRIDEQQGLQQLSLFNN
ncbi:MAG: phage antirepressor N-terminal domain-containing protein [Bacteroidota bacterium]